ncbi:MAG: hypothetical protein WD794_07945 [Mycobacteriales bacterium]
MPYAFVVADMEAGLEHLSWAGGTLRYADLLLVVLQPTAKVLLTADRAHRLAVELGIADVAFVGNRVREADRPRLEEFAAERGRRLLGVIPHDDAVIEADRRGMCVLDYAPDSPAVQAIQQLARVLDEQQREARSPRQRRP